MIYVIRDLDDEKVIEIFYKNKLQKANQKEFRIEKVIKKWLRKNQTNYMLNENDMIIPLIVELVKKMLYKNESIFS